MLAHGPDEPHLGHAHDGAEDAEAEGGHGGEAGGEEVRGGVDGGVVAGGAALEEEVFGEGDAFVDGEPVAWGRGWVGVSWFLGGWARGLRRGGGGM